MHERAIAERACGIDRRFDVATDVEEVVRVTEVAPVV
jgi:hypothetical protein